MSATMTLERQDGSAVQITAGSTDNGTDVRYLVFRVPETNDSVQLDWEAGADPAAGPVPVLLHIGTLPARKAWLEDGKLRDSAPPAEPPFGPNAEGILHAVRQACAGFVLAHPVAMSAPRGQVPKHTVQTSAGEVPKDKVDVGEAPGKTNAQYAAAGSAVAVLVTGDPTAAAAGAVLGAAIGTVVALTEVAPVRGH